MDDFKVGDRVVYTATINSQYPKEKGCVDVVLATNEGCLINIKLDHGRCIEVSYKNLVELINSVEQPNNDTKGDNMSVSVEQINNLNLSEEDQLLVDNALMFSNGVATQLGIAVSNQKTFVANKEALVKDIRALKHKPAQV